MDSTWSGTYIPAMKAKLFPILVDIWIRKIDEAPQDELGPQTELQHRTECISAALAVTRLVGEDKVLHQRLVSAPGLGGNTGRVASLLLKYLNKTIDAAEWRVAFPALVGLCAMLSETIPKLRYDLLSQNSMVYITRALASFSSQPISPSNNKHTVFDANPFTPLVPPQLDNENHRLSILTGVHYVSEGTLATDGFTWLIQAIRCRLLPSLPKAAMWSYKDLDNSILHTIRILGSYLCVELKQYFFDRGTIVPCLTSRFPLLCYTTCRLCDARFLKREIASC
jgi:hypothetical protein